MKRKRRGALTIEDLIYLFVAIIVLSQLFPTILQYTNQGASQSAGLAAVFWNMIPWVILLGLIATIIQKARTPSVEYQE